MKKHNLNWKIILPQYESVKSIKIRQSSTIKTKSIRRKIITATERKSSHTKGLKKQTVHPPDSRASHNYSSNLSWIWVTRKHHFAIHSHILCMVDASICTRNCRFLKSVCIIEKMSESCGVHLLSVYCFNCVSCIFTESGVWLYDTFFEIVRRGWWIVQKIMKLMVQFVAETLRCVEIANEQLNLNIVLFIDFCQNVIDLNL